MLRSDKLQSAESHTRDLLKLHVNISCIRPYDYILGNTVDLNSIKCTSVTLNAVKLFKTLEFVVYALRFNRGSNIAMVLLQSPTGLDS